jgi:hypothetical protein
MALSGMDVSYKSPAHKRFREKSASFTRESLDPLKRTPTLRKNAC